MEVVWIFITFRNGVVLEMKSKIWQPFLAAVMVVSIVTMSASLASATFTTTPMIAAGENHTVALRSDGTVWAWGANFAGQLGDGTGGDWDTPSSPVPVQVLNLNNITAIAAGRPGMMEGSAGRHTLALRNDGTVWSWGDNRRGQLGNGKVVHEFFCEDTDRWVTEHGHSSSPTQVLNLDNVTTITTGNAHSVALRSDGTVWAWGCNINGQLGHVPAHWHNDEMDWEEFWATSIRATPIQVPNLNNVIAIAAGNFHTLALRSDGTVWTWGAFFWDEPPIGNTITQVQNIDNVIAISANIYSSMALRDDGTVWEWAANYYFETIPPVQIQNINNITAIAGGSEHSVAIRNNGTVWAWGINVDGQLGNGNVSVRVYCDGTNCWRYDFQGHCFPGNCFLDYSTYPPAQVLNLNNAIAIAAGGRNQWGRSFAIRSDGTVWGWGNNWSGALGDGTLPYECEDNWQIIHNWYHTLPVQVVGNNGIGFFNVFNISVHPEFYVDNPTIDNAENTATLDIENLTDTSKTVHLVSTQFDNNGRFTGTELVAVSIPAGQSRSATVGFDEGSRIFLWESGTMQPIINAVHFD